MYLKKKPILSDGTPENSSESDNGGVSDATAMVVEELLTSLNTQRLYRELTLSLRTGLRDACAEFSFLRIRGLRSLLKTLRSVAESDSIIRLFSHTQTISDLQLVPVIFRHSLKEAKDDDDDDDRVMSLDHIFSVEAMKITSPSTDDEVAVALKVLEGCCLLHPQSTLLAHKHGAVRAKLIQAQQHKPKEENDQNDTASASSSPSCTKDKSNGNNGKEHDDGVKKCTDSVGTQIPMCNRFAVLESSNDC